jgi:hypothetical protein
MPPILSGQYLASMIWQVFAGFFRTSSRGLMQGLRLQLVAGTLAGAARGSGTALGAVPEASAAYLALRALAGRMIVGRRGADSFRG